MRYLILTLLLISCAVAQGPNIVDSVPDTTSLKTLNAGDGTVVFLKQYSSSDATGGGWFIVRESSEATGTNYFNHPASGRQWAREELDQLAYTTASDTTALKALSMGEGSTTYLKQLSSANTNGGGWFAVIDSAHEEGIVAFDHPTAGLQWVRDIYRIRGAIKPSWAGAVGDGSTDDNSAFQRLLNYLSGKKNLTLELGGPEKVYNIIGEVTSYNIKDLTIDGSGATLKSTGDWNDNGADNGGYLTFCSLTSDQNDSLNLVSVSGADTSWFLDHGYKGYYYLKIADSSSWKPIEKGDGIVIGSTNKTLGGYRIGQLMFFSKFDTTSDGSQAIYFDLPFYHDLGVDTSLYGLIKLPMRSSITVKNLRLNNFAVFSQYYKAVNINNIHAFQDVYTTYHDSSIAKYVIGADARYVNVNNMTVTDYSRPGFGYGIFSTYFGVMNINNFNGFDNRHSLTTSTSAWHYNGVLNVSNSYTGMGYDANQSNNNHFGFDTHAMTWEANFNNCTAENTQGGFHIRCTNATVSNSVVKNCDYGVYSERDVVEDKDYLIIDNLKVWYTDTTTGPTAFLKTTGSYKKITIKNSEVDYSKYTIPDSTDDGGSVSHRSIWISRSGTDGVRIDSLIIRGNVFKGPKWGYFKSTGTFLHSGTTVASGYDGIIGYLEVKNNTIGDYTYWNSHQPNYDQMLIENNNFTNFQYWWYVADDIGADPADHWFKHTLIKGNLFKRMRGLFNWSNTKFQVDELNIVNNDFELIGYPFYLTTRVNLLNFDLSNNRFRNCCYHVGGIWAHGGYAENIRITGNTWFALDTTEINSDIDVYYDKGYQWAQILGYTGSFISISGDTLASDSSRIPKVRIINNDVYMDALQVPAGENAYMNFTKIDLDFVGNRILPDTSMPRRVFYFDSVDANILSNEIIMNRGNLLEIVTFPMDSTDSQTGNVLTITGNLFANKVYHSSNRYFGPDNDSCRTVTLTDGENRFWNIDNDGDWSCVADTNYVTSKGIYLNGSDSPHDIYKLEVDADTLKITKLLR